MFRSWLKIRVLKRILHITTITLATVALAMTAAAWFLSYDHNIVLRWDHAGRRYQLASERGGIIYASGPYGHQHLPIHIAKRREPFASFANGSWNTDVGWSPSPGFLGFSNVSGDYEPLFNLTAPPAPAQHYVIWRIPYWFPVAAITLALALRFATHRRRPQAARNSSCRTCGYDLRVTPNRCPERGQEPHPTSR